MPDFDRNQVLTDVLERAVDQVRRQFRGKRPSEVGGSTLADRVRKPISQAVQQAVDDVAWDLQVNIHDLVRKNTNELIEMIVENLETGSPVQARGWRFATNDKLSRIVARYASECDQKEAITPEGWEDTVRKLKKHPEIDNPWALVNWMKGEGYTPGGK